MGKHLRKQLPAAGQLPVAVLRAAVLLSLLPATVACDLCAECVCATTDAFCVSRSLGDPVAQPSHVETLYIQGCNLTDEFLAGSNIHLVRSLHIVDCPLAAAGRHTFAQLRNLQLLEVSRTPLRQLWPQALAGNTRLRHVDLSSNRLGELPVALFARLARLSTAVLRGNRLTGVRNRTFAYNRRLRHLDLSGNCIALLEPGALHVGEVHEALSTGPAGTVNISNNLLREVLDDAFLQCPGVAVLDLSANRISFLATRAFHGLRRLTHLRLQNNALQHLTPQVLSPLASLQVLDLSDNALVALPAGGLCGNRLATLDKGALGGCPALERLDLARSGLRRLGCALANLTALEELNLLGNPLQELRARDFAGLRRLKDLRLGLGDDAPCQCSLFARLKENHVRLTLEEVGRALSAQCSSLYRQYLHEDGVDCGERDERENQCQWRYADAISDQSDGSRLLNGQANVFGYISYVDCIKMRRDVLIEDRNRPPAEYFEL